MTDPVEPVRPVPRWLHAWAVLTVCITLVLLVLGQLVTSFRAGMADPIWPTEPWYLFVVGWQEPNRGYLIEHSHRIAGWTVGIVVSVLALGLWWTESDKTCRWGGLLFLGMMLASYGELHRQLIAQRDPAVPIRWPTLPFAQMAVAFLGVVSINLGRRRAPAAGVRFLGIVALVAVMIQGLLGGFRVRLDALLGPELAPVHGVFAQVVFCLLVALAVLTGRPVSTVIPDPARRTLRRLSLALVGLLFVQLVWGAMVRHTPSPLNQRLHLLTAFLVVAAAVWLLRVGFTTPAARPRVAFAGWVLGLLVALQVALGVEAWMGKFGDEARQGKAAAGFLPEAAAVSAKQAATRTAHTLVGTGVLAAAVVLALRVGSRSSSESGSGGGRVMAAKVGHPAPALALTAPGETP